MPSRNTQWFRPQGNQAPPSPVPSWPLDGAHTKGKSITVQTQSVEQKNYTAARIYTHKLHSQGVDCMIQPTCRPLEGVLHTPSHMCTDASATPSHRSARKAICCTGFIWLPWRYRISKFAQVIPWQRKRRLGCKAEAQGEPREAKAAEANAAPKERPAPQRQETWQQEEVSPTTQAPVVSSQGSFPGTPSKVKSAGGKGKGVKRCKGKGDQQATKNTKLQEKRTKDASEEHRECSLREQKKRSLANTRGVLREER